MNAVETKTNCISARRLSHLDPTKPVSPINRSAIPNSVSTPQMHQGPQSFTEQKNKRHRTLSPRRTAAYHGKKTSRFCVILWTDIILLSLHYDLHAHLRLWSFHQCPDTLARKTDAQKQPFLSKYNLFCLRTDKIVPLGSSDISRRNTSREILDPLGQIILMTFTDSYYSSNSRGTRASIINLYYVYAGIDVKCRINSG